MYYAMKHLSLAAYKGMKKRNKYGVSPKCDRTDSDGIVHASKKEMNDWLDLKRLEKIGAIRDLKRQVHFPLVVDGERICVYVADATYTTKEGEYVVQDSKGILTPVFRLKAKLFRAIMGIDIRIT